MPRIKAAAAGAGVWPVLLLWLAVLLPAVEARWRAAATTCTSYARAQTFIPPTHECHSPTHVSRRLLLCPALPAPLYSPVPAPGSLQDE